MRVACYLRYFFDMRFRNSLIIFFLIGQLVVLTVADAEHSQFVIRNAKMTMDRGVYLLDADIKYELSGPMT